MEAPRSERPAGVPDPPVPLFPARRGVQRGLSRAFPRQLPPPRGTYHAPFLGQGQPPAVSGPAAHLRGSILPRVPRRGPLARDGRRDPQPRDRRAGLRRRHAVRTRPALPPRINRHLFQGAANDGRQRLPRRFPGRVPRHGRTDDRRLHRLLVPGLHDAAVQRQPFSGEGRAAARLPGVGRGISRQRRHSPDGHRRTRRSRPGAPFAGAAHLGILRPAQRLGEGRHGDGPQGRAAGILALPARQRYVRTLAATSMRATRR